MTFRFSKDIRWSCTAILFLCLQITRADIRPQVKRAVNLVIAYDHLIFLKSVRMYLWVNILTYQCHIKVDNVLAQKAWAFKKIFRCSELTYIK